MMHSTAMERFPRAESVCRIHRGSRPSLINRRGSLSSKTQSSPHHLDRPANSASFSRGGSLRTRSRRKEDLNDPAQIGATGTATERVPVSVMLVGCNDTCAHSLPEFRVGHVPWLNGWHFVQFVSKVTHGYAIIDWCRTTEGKSAWPST